MEEVRKKLISFLEDNSSTFIKSWRENVIISDTDIHKEEVIYNGMKMFELVKQRLNHTLSEEGLRDFAYKVAVERLEANINIGDFVYNANAGRSEVINWVISSGIALEYLPQIIEEINSSFDLFNYYVVKKYTEIKEEQLQKKNIFIDQTHKERLKILGQMSSSFVHEFRNPLTTLLGFTKLIGTEYPFIKYIDIIERELHQLNARVTQFLHVSKKELINGDMKINSLYELFDELIHFIYPSIVDVNVSITNNIEPGIMVYANKEELRQVFLNILLNSIDALQQVKHSKEINIDCKTINEKAEIMISNNGPVIPKEISNVIFEPFYTTKELGTGIGLYVCKNIIEKYNGEISVDSDYDITSFYIKIPLLVSNESPN
ncbi:sensor histidine kinase [Chengkuizengella axinellae]|uniref:histidine kinase n=1 Tax=Chengkuizengella axinellae TaxID=3064388 RepID=A0ABT9J583_9BACL|nr:HAMP domain-containing sensor histidine kinase [Chengkuizengella sp. 2205SS18-9]MDP5276771.1 HAMP domain-containing sensor histidine kinase [Chengkuizengella sp. 2205SS18-9]